MSQHLDWDYDLWANKQWIEQLPSMKEYVRAQEIMRHILWAQSIWLERCVQCLGPEPLLQPLSGNAVQDSEMLNRAWSGYVAKHGGQTMVTYTNLAGVERRNSLNQIQAHVLNHGTYHRGHLRGLVEAEGRTDFPDTDFMRFVW